MYLLQTTADDLFLPSILACLIGLLIFYYLVKGAVKSANTELHQQLKLHNTLKIREMQKQGYSEEEIKKYTEEAFKWKP